MSTPDPVDVAYNIFVETHRNTSVGYALRHDPEAERRVRDFIRKLINKDEPTLVEETTQAPKLPPLQLKEPKMVKIGNLADFASPTTPITSDVSVAAAASEVTVDSEKQDVETK